MEHPLGLPFGSNFPQNQERYTQPTWRLGKELLDIVSWAHRSVLALSLMSRKPGAKLVLGVLYYFACCIHGIR